MEDYAAIMCGKSDNVENLLDLEIPKIADIGII